MASSPSVEKPTAVDWSPPSVTAIAWSTIGLILSVLGVLVELPKAVRGPIKWICSLALLILALLLLWWLSTKLLRLAKNSLHRLQKFDELHDALTHEQSKVSIEQDKVQQLTGLLIRAAAASSHVDTCPISQAVYMSGELHLILSSESGFSFEPEDRWLVLDRHDAFFMAELVVTNNLSPANERLARLERWDPMFLGRMSVFANNREPVVTRGLAYRFRFTEKMEQQHESE